MRVWPWAVLRAQPVVHGAAGPIQKRWGGGLNVYAYADNSRTKYRDRSVWEVTSRNGVEESRVELYRTLLSIVCPPPSQADEIRRGRTDDSHVGTWTSSIDQHDRASAAFRS